MAAINPEYLDQLIRDNPCVMLENGNIRSCPVRLSWPHLFKPAKPMDDSPDKTPKYQLTALFPSLVRFDKTAEDPLNFNNTFRKAVGAKAVAEFGQDVQPSQLKLPFRNGSDKAHVEGYVEGNLFLSMTSNNKPMVVDHTGKLITDESRVYPGVWGIVTCNPFSYTTGRRGVSFGLRSVMIVADDEPFGDSAPSDPQVDFSGVKVSGAGLIAKGAGQRAEELF